MAFRPMSGFPVRASFTPQCTHLTMTRLYGNDRCESCHRPGSFGWVYRCTQDRDDLIEQAAEMGFSTAFDRLGHDFTGEMATNIRRGSPAAREDKLSFFSEIAPEQMASYRPDQIARILRQREELHSVIRQEKLKKYSALLPQRFRPLGADGLTPEFAFDNPWSPRSDEECHYKICGYCRPGSADRAYVSLNAVANGELPPTAATGYGFHALRMRPVIDANVLKTIGLRAAPSPRTIDSSEYCSSTADYDMMEMLEEQIAQSRGRWQKNEDEHEHDQEAMLSRLKPSPGQLKYSPACDNLAAYVAPSELTPRFMSQGASVRPPWTPPPSPSRFGKESMAECHVLGLAAEPSVTDGRSSVSLKTNPTVRNQILSSVPSTSALAHIKRSGYSVSDDHHVPYLPESAYDVGLTLPFDPEAYELARNVPLTPPDVAEERYLHEATSPMIEFENDEGIFTPAPLQVEHGVAVLEESIELGVPDVITQV